MTSSPKMIDIDAVETREWLDSLRSVIDRDGIERAHFLLAALVDHARASGANLPFPASTPYVNTIPESRAEHTPGDPAIEWRIRSLIRWNALAMVVQANRLSSELGGHIASFASAATLYDVGFNHFWHAPNEAHGGDLIFMQGHSAPGIYARAFLEGRLSEDRLHKFRQEIDGEGLSSYPHPWLMPDFWQFPTVSMGLGPIMAIYQARFMKYLHNRGLLDTSQRKVWAFMGDGRWTSPRRSGRSPSPRARSSTTSSSSSTATSSGSTGRYGATARSSRSWRRRSAARGGTSSRWSGARTGTRCCSSTPRGCCASAWRRRSTASTRTSRRRAGRTRGSTSSASTRS